MDSLADQLEGSCDALAGIRFDSAVWKILPQLIGRPVVNTRYLVNALGLSDATIVCARDVLVERGVLVERTGFSRNRVWEQRGILNVLDSYAERIRRTI